MSDPIRKGRQQLILLASVFLGPLLIAFVFFYGEIGVATRKQHGKRSTDKSTPIIAGHGLASKCERRITEVSRQMVSYNFWR